MNKNHSNIYSYAELYDIAFDFRNVKKQCDFFEDISKKYNKNIENFLELCAGPARHTIEMSKRGFNSTAIDLSEGMKNYSLELAKKENVKIDYQIANIKNFKLTKKFDVIVMLMDSFSYLLTDEDVYECLKNISDHLNENGLFIIEMSHPRDIFLMGESFSTNWDSERNSIKVNFKFSSEEDEFDPITQIKNTTFEITATKNNNPIKISEKALQKCYTTTEFKAITKASNSLKIIDFFGDLDIKVKFDNNHTACRMIPILQRKE